MATGNLNNNTDWTGSFTLEKQSGTVLTLDTGSTYVGKDIALTLAAQLATPSFDGGALNNKAATANFTNMTISDFNSSGVAIQACGSAGRDSVLYNGAVNGWVSAADNATAAGSVASEDWTGTTYFATGVTLGKGKSFSVTVPNGSEGTITYPFSVDANGNTTIDGVAHNYTAYGFHIDSSESDPSACVTYLEYAIGMTPAFMDYTRGTFDWGSWGNAFFLPRPCMLKYDGTVDYYLDPNDYTKKADGTASDVGDWNYGGNAMMEWGQNGKKIWYKIVPDNDDTTSASVYIADNQVDSGYQAWSFINNQGDLVDHFYTPIYNGSIDGDGRLRSISGKTYDQLCQSKTAPQEIAAAELNNPQSSAKMWYTEVFADVTIINLLLILMGKSLNTQAVFGNGNVSSGSSADKMIATGTMNDKGLFWGANDSTHGVKVFGMENWWGNQNRRYAGHVLSDYVHKYKLTRTNADGSNANDYVSTNTLADYNGYLTGPSAPTTSNYVKTMGFNTHGFYTTATGGTNVNASHYWCDYFYQSSGLKYAYRGGDCSYGLIAGAFCVHLGSPPSLAYWHIGASPSCKPLLT